MLGLLRACQRGLGIAMLPDYLVEENGGLVQLFGDAETLALDAFFVYPEELKSVARIQVFRDFLVATRSAGIFERGSRPNGPHPLPFSMADMRLPALPGRRPAAYSRHAVHRMYILPESPVCSMFPSGSMCRSPHRHTQTGPLMGPGFFS